MRSRRALPGAWLVGDRVSASSPLLNPRGAGGATGNLAGRKARVCPRIPGDGSSLSLMEKGV